MDLNCAKKSSQKILSLTNLFASTKVAGLEMAAFAQVVAGAFSAERADLD
jgi:hypothetical protein